MDKTKKVKFKKVVEQLKKQNTSNTLKEMVELVEKNTEQQDESIEQLQRGQEYLESAQVQEMPGNVLTPPGQLESVESVEEPKAVENSKSIAELQAELDRVNALIAGFEKKKPKGKKTATKVKQSQAKQVLSGETPDLTSPNNTLSVPKEETAEPVAAEKKTRGPKGSEKLISTLNRIYTFMQKNREMDVTEREKELSKAEDIKQLKEQRHKELIDALKGISGSGGDTAKREKPGEKPGEDSGGGILGMLGALVGGKLLKGLKGKLLGKGAEAAEGLGKGAAKGATGAAEGLAEGAAKSATKVSKILNGAKGVLKFLQKIPGLSMIAAGATLIFDIKNAIDAHEAGKLDDNGLKKQITKSLGGALGGLGGAEIGGLLGGALGSVIPGAGTLVGGILGGAAGFFGGEKLGEMAAEKAFDFFSGGQDKDPPSDPLKEADKMKKKEGGATPAAAGAAPAAPSGGSGGAMPVASASATPSAGGGAASAPAASASPSSGGGGGSSAAPSSSGGGSAAPAMPTASPVGGGGAVPGTPAAPATGGAPATPPAAPAAAPTAMPAAPPPAPSSALAPMMEKNQDMKLDAASSGGGTTVNNNTESTSGSTGPDKTKGPMPSIRNKDSTFERLVYYSTRVV